MSATLLPLSRRFRLAAIYQGLITPVRISDDREYPASLEHDIRVVQCRKTPNRVSTNGAVSSCLKENVAAEIEAAQDYSDELRTRINLESNGFEPGDDLDEPASSQDDRPCRGGT
jgi:hypothetical protein